MADQNPNLAELMEALEAERLKVRVLKSEIEVYKQAISNLNGIIQTIMANVTITGDEDAVVTVLSVWRDMLKELERSYEADKRQQDW